MRVERTIIVIALLLVMAVALKDAMADPVAPTGVNTTSSSRASLSTTNKSINAQAGNVTQLEFNATTITDSWTGYFGNVTSNIVLQDSSGNNFYNWSNANPTGEIFASRNQTLSWGGIKCAISPEISAEESYLGHSATDADSVTNTYSLTSHPTFSVGGTALSGCSSTHAFSNTGTDASLWWNVLVSDDANNTIYTTLLNSSQTGFDGGLWDFQLLVGENGSGGGASLTTPYYFFVELS